MAAPKLERLKAAEVCQIAQVQPYVLRSWEAEFTDLGQVTAAGLRIYGRADVDRVLRIRELVYGEGLTLAGARRRLEEELQEAREADQPAVEDEELSLVDDDMRTRLRAVREGLQSVLTLLERPLGSAGAAPFELVAAAPDVPVAAPKTRRARR